MSKLTKTVEVPIWELREISNTLRMVANVLDSPERKTCLDREVMRSWNHVVDRINGHTPTISERLSYYNKAGQMPNINE